MTDIRKLIADTITQHTHSGDFEWCYCGKRLSTTQNWEEEWADHIADKLIETLGLTTEWTWTWPETLTTSGQPGYGFSVDTREEAAAEGPGYSIVSRHVTEWKPA